MNQKYYRIELDDPAEPGFCSVSKSYFGTLSDIAQVVERMDSNGRCPDTVLAFREFLEGNPLAEHRVCNNAQVLMHPVDLLEKQQFELDEVHFDHKNIWDSIRRLRASQIDVEQVLLREGNRYYRCIRPVFADLQYISRIDGTFRDVGTSIWGNKDIMLYANNVHTMALYTLQQQYTDYHCAMADMDQKTLLDYSAACDEIFGDG